MTELVIVKESKPFSDKPTVE